MCIIVKNPFLLIGAVLIYSLIYAWINKRLIRNGRDTDVETHLRAVEESDIDREIWQSDKNEEVLRNIFVLTIKKSISQWQSAHVAIVAFYLANLGLISLLIYMLVFRC